LDLIFNEFKLILFGDKGYIGCIQVITPVKGPVEQLSKKEKTHNYQVNKYRYIG